MGDPDLLTQTVMRRVPVLTLYARQWVDAAWAEDAVQEALTALLAERIVPDDPIAWMFRAVHNAAIDLARSSSRRRRREESVAKGRREWFESRPDSAIAAADAEELLRGLEPLDRRIVVLRVWGDLGFVQIAQLMNVAVSTAHQRYVAALQQMRNRLEKPCPNKMD
jgi:RNA polymerase sigma factor (sigma-70 family)